MTVFRVLAGLVSAYMMLCFARIIITWFPSLSFSSFGRFLTQVCDPYLNLFRGLKFLRFGVMDFTPAIAICILVALSSIFNNLALGGKFSLSALLIIILSLAWRIVFDLLLFLTVFLLLRLGLNFLHKDNSPIFDRVDYAINPVIFKITNIFTRGRPTPFTTALIVSAATIFAVMLMGNFLVKMLMAVLASIPF